MEIQDIISSGLLEAYATGIATPGERAQVDAWVEAYPEVAAELTEIEKSMEQFAFANAVQPDEKIKSKIFDKINADTTSTPFVSEKKEAKVYSISPIWQRAAAAAILLLIGSIILNIIFYKKFDKAQLAYEQKNKELIAQSEKVNDLDQYSSVAQNKYSKTVSLDGQAKAPDAAAKIFWMKNTGEVYIDASNLPEAPKGKQYQFWGIVDGKPVDGGMIEFTNKAGNKYHVQKMKTFGKADAFAVTLEDVGGKPTPTMENMYVMGKSI